MTSRRLLLAFTSHRGIVAWACSFLGQKGVQGQFALNLRLIGHVEKLLEMRI